MLAHWRGGRMNILAPPPSESPGVPGLGVPGQ